MVMHESKSLQIYIFQMFPQQFFSHYHIIYIKKKLGYERSKYRYKYCVLKVLPTIKYRNTRMNHKMIQVTFVYDSFNHDINQHKTVLYTSYNIIFHDTSFSTLLQVGFYKESIELFVCKRVPDIYLAYQPVPYGLHFE